jgi:deoxyribodipyrimidine photo-lyase
MPVPGQAERRAGPVIVWFRDDLRVGDHPALAAAAATRRPVICFYLLDEESSGLRPLGGAARWWLAGSLRALADALRERGGHLVLRRGVAADAIFGLAAQTNASAVFMNRRDDPAGAAIDCAVAARLAAGGTEVKTFAANLLHDPSTLRTGSGRPFQVFTPFWRQLRGAGPPRPPILAPSRIVGASGVAGDTLGNWDLEPTHPDWAAGMRASWVRGEAGAQRDLEVFLAHGIKGYAAKRDRPDLPHTSRLSPRLRFGELSPHQVWHASFHAAAAGRAADADVEKLLSELGWREFCYHLLHQQPALASVNFNRRFDAFPWREDATAVAAWQQGRTGYPLVDAGMRQLWATGWMHNRVRMVTASFLIKHLLIDWRVGEKWFWDTLVDADVASNPANWQWVAGSGADAAPYFRIFNPVLQGEKFDPGGDYVRRFVPELGRLDAHSTHAPHRAPPLALATAGVTLGKTYPAPIVIHEDGRRRALAALATIKSPEC